ncbi:MAG: glycosyltransferase family 4 protein [Gemmatimonadaceae bacterium]
MKGRSRAGAQGPIRVAVVIPRYTPIFGGSENQCRQLNRCLRATGAVEIPYVVTKRIRPDLPRVESIDGVPVYRLDPPGVSRWSEYSFYCRAFMFLWRRRRQYDVIHCHATSIIGFVITVLSLVTRRPAVLKLSSNGELMTGLHNFSGQLRLDRSLTGRLRRPLARFAARHAHIVALNEEGADELRLARARWPHVVSNGVDTAFFRPASPEVRGRLRRELGFGEDRFVFLYAGRFVSRKGIDALLDAYRRLARRPDGARMVLCLVGSGELQADPIAVAAEAGGRPDAVRVFPAADDLRPFLHMADAFVFPSRREGMPNAVLEATAAGLPCVLSDIRPHRELAARNPGARCYLFASGDAADLERALVRCEREERAAGPWRSAGVAPQFELGSVAERYVELYRSVVGLPPIGAALGQPAPAPEPHAGRP